MKFTPRYAAIAPAPRIAATVVERRDPEREAARHPGHERARARRPSIPRRARAGMASSAGTPIAPATIPVRYTARASGARAATFASDQIPGPIPDSTTSASGMSSRLPVNAARNSTGASSMRSLNVKVTSRISGVAFMPPARYVGNVRRANRPEHHAVPAQLPHLVSGYPGRRKLGQHERLVRHVVDQAAGDDSSGDLGTRECLLARRAPHVDALVSTTSSHTFCPPRSRRTTSTVSL